MTQSDAMCLPAELVDFFRAGKQLNYAPTELLGPITLKKLEDLRTQEVAIWSFDDTDHELEDPHVAQGHYVVPGVGLIATRGGRPDNDQALLWFPSYKKFGHWDREHNHGFRFTQSTWLDIVADPVAHLNAAWVGGKCPKRVKLTPWRDSNYDFRKGDPNW